MTAPPSRMCRSLPVSIALAALVSALMTTPAAADVLTFQQGTASYGSCQDTELNSGTPGTSLGGATGISVDTNTLSHGLIRFDNIFGAGAGQIPLGSTIHAATLTLNVFDPSSSGATITFHRMLIPWTDADTWNSLGSGVQADDTEALSATDATVPSPNATGTKVVTLGSSLQDWSNGAANEGWVILTNSSDGWDFDSADNGTVGNRPLLTVDFTPPAVIEPPVVQGVQSGTAVSSGNGTVTVSIASVDPARSFLVFNSRHASNRPVGSMIRGRIASATTLEFARVTDETSTMDIQWYVVEYASGVRVQRGEVSQSSAVVNVPLAPLQSVDQAFATWSKTPTSTDGTWGQNDPVLGEITSTTNLQLRTEQAASSHTIWWQVVEFLDPATATVQKGSITSMGTTATSVTATLSPPMDPSRTFVLVSHRINSSATDIGSHLVKARLTDSTTVTIERATAGGDITEIVWQAIEMNDGTTVQQGVEAFANGEAQRTVAISGVDLTRTSALATSQHSAGQASGTTPYAADDVPGVASATLALPTATQLVLDRSSTVDSAEIAWSVVQWGPAAVVDADLAVTKSVDDATPDEGGTVVFTVSLSNAGPAAATGVQVTDLLPAGLTFVSSTATAGTYASGTGLWDLGASAAGAADTLTVTATVDAGTGGSTLTNTATVTASDSPDPNGANDSASASVVVNLPPPSADLAVTKSAGAALVQEADSVTFTITLTNLGPDATTGVEVTDLLPAGLTYVSDAATQGTYTPGTGVWAVASLSASAVDTLTITATVDSGTLGQTIQNTASVTASGLPDPNAANDTASASVTVTDGSRVETQLTTDVTDARPAWSPDGSTIAFDSQRSGNQDLWSIPAGGGAVTQLTFSSTIDRHPNWDPSGAFLVFAANPGGGNTNLYTKPAAGGPATLVQPDPTTVDGFPAWSPDSTQFVYRKTANLFLVPVGGGVPVALDTDPAVDTHPTWSPDGTMIAFQSNRSGNDDIWVIPATGGVATQITFDPGTDASPDWSPDGSQIAFHSDRGGQNNIWVIPATGGTATQLTTDPAGDLDPDWGPSGQEIVFMRSGSGLWILTLGSGGAPVAVSSAADQVFAVGDAPTPISPITVTDATGSPAITAALDLRIRIPAGLSLDWDTSDVTATLTGSAASKVSGTVSYEDAGKTLVLDVTADFASGEDLTVADLAFTHFAAASGPASLELEVANDDLVSATDPRTIEITAPTPVTLPTGVPAEFALSAAQPNPFRGATSIRFDLPVRGTAELSVFDIQGRLVRTLAGGEIDAGSHVVRWDGRDSAGKAVAAGIYFLQLRDPNQATTRKVVRLQ